MPTQSTAGGGGDGLRSPVLLCVYPWPTNRSPDTRPWLFPVKPPPPNAQEPPARPTLGPALLTALGTYVIKSDFLLSSVSG